jgi:hypothetical protein
MKQPLTQQNLLLHTLCLGVIGRIVVGSLRIQTGLIPLPVYNGDKRFNQ